MLFSESGSNEEIFLTETNYNDMEDSWNFLKLLLQCKTCANVLAFGFGDRFAKLKPDSQIENRFAEKPDLSPTANTCTYNTLTTHDSDNTR